MVIRSHFASLPSGPLGAGQPRQLFLSGIALGFSEAFPTGRAEQFSQALMEIKVAFDRETRALPTSHSNFGHAFHVIVESDCDHDKRSRR